MSKNHVIVTGASRGLGEAVVRHLAEKNWAISFGARSHDALKSIKNELPGPTDNYFIERLDVSDEQNVASFFDQAIAVSGVPTAVVHSAGVYGPFGATKSINANDWMASIKVNLLGTLLVLQRSIIEMEKEQFGRIIVLSGGGATSPMPNISAYAASKSGVVRLVETVARELSQTGIVLNAVAPGLMATKMLDEVLEAGPAVVGREFYERMELAKENQEDSTLDAVELISFLVQNTIPGLTGRLISAKWDPWRQWIQDASSLADSENYTLRRQVPASD